MHEEPAAFDGQPAPEVPESPEAPAVTHLEAPKSPAASEEPAAPAVPTLPKLKIPPRKNILSKSQEDMKMSVDEPAKVSILLFHLSIPLSEYYATHLSAVISERLPKLPKLPNPPSAALRLHRHRHKPLRTLTLTNLIGSLHMMSNLRCVPFIHSMRSSKNGISV
jgi:hypothetical protein